MGWLVGGGGGGAVLLAVTWTCAAAVLCCSTAAAVVVHGKMITFLLLSLRFRFALRWKDKASPVPSSNLPLQVSLVLFQHYL